MVAPGFASAIVCCGSTQLASVFPSVLWKHAFGSSFSTCRCKMHALASADSVAFFMMTCQDGSAHKQGGCVSAHASGMRVCVCVSLFGSVTNLGVCVQWLDSSVGCAESALAKARVSSSVIKNNSGCQEPYTHCDMCCMITEDCPSFQSLRSTTHVCRLVQYAVMFT